MDPQSGAQGNHHSVRHGFHQLCRNNTANACGLQPKDTALLIAHIAYGRLKIIIRSNWC